jgi:riboflavin-specific deaminase-like protein
VTEIVDLGEPDDIASHYLADERPPRPDRPWVTLGMISSLDGAISVDGRSSDLGGPADRAAFRALRATADVVLVGAGTVRAEGYHRVRLPDRFVAWRRERGMADAPRVAIVSRSLDLDLTDDLRVSVPLIVAPADAPSERLEELGRSVEVLVAGTGGVDLVFALRELRRRGVGRVTLEGGPQLNAQMVASGLVDEMCVTIAPVTVGGTTGRMIAGEMHSTGLTLTRAIHSQGFLLMRYLVD